MSQVEIEIESEPFAELEYENAVGRGQVEYARLPFFRGKVHGWPGTFDGLVITADLQGFARDPLTYEPRLLGIAVAEYLDELHGNGLIPAPSQMAALLAGDYFAIPASRGGFGCVREVWQAFADRFEVVAGVAGNHDDVSHLPRWANVHFLDGEARKLNSLTIGGVGLIAGNNGKPGRREAQQQCDLLGFTAEQGPQILLLHQGPAGPGERHDENPWITDVIESFQIPLTVCGHRHWSTPLVRKQDSWILNAHERVIVLEAGER